MKQSMVVLSEDQQQSLRAYFTPGSSLCLPTLGGVERNVIGIPVRDSFRWECPSRIVGESPQVWLESPFACRKEGCAGKKKMGRMR